MSLGPISQQEWLNRNSLRSFPVSDGMSLLLDNGGELPNSVLVDMFVVASLPGPGRLYVSTVCFTLTTVTVVVADVDTGASIGYATGLLGHTPPNSSVAIQSPSGFGSGSVTFGDILNTSSHHDYGTFIGSHRQPVNRTLDRRCFIYTGRPMIERMKVDHQDGEVIGNATISLGNEIQAYVSEIEINGVKETQVELSLISPEEFLPACYPRFTSPLCFCDRPTIVTINGVPRDEDGDLGIDIVFSSGVVGGIIDNKSDENSIELALERQGDEVCFKESAGIVTGDVSPQRPPDPFPEEE